jgi:hypothetical protein
MPGETMRDVDHAEGGVKSGTTKMVMWGTRGGRRIWWKPWRRTPCHRYQIPVVVTTFYMDAPGAAFSREASLSVNGQHYEPKGIKDLVWLTVWEWGKEVLPDE